MIKNNKLCMSGNAEMVIDSFSYSSECINLSISDECDGNTKYYEINGHKYFIEDINFVNN